MPHPFNTHSRNNAVHNSGANSDQTGGVLFAMSISDGRTAVRGGITVDVVRLSPGVLARGPSELIRSQMLHTLHADNNGPILTAVLFQRDALTLLVKTT